MKKTAFYSMMACAALMGAASVLSSCNDKANKTNTNGADSTVVENSVPDSTVYGTCGEGTTMNSLELITDAGDTLQYLLADDGGEEQGVQGGLLAGDRMAVIEGQPLDGDKVAAKVINLTTLLGKWVSLDKNFEIMEGGTVKSYLKAETKPWTTWKIVNGNLVFNRDTFMIDKLANDSLYIENKDGIFTYKRP